MHGIAEAVSQLQSGAGERALVTCNGGMLSKHASGLYSRTPNTTDWSAADTQLSNEEFVRRTIAPAPTAGTIVTYTVNYGKDAPEQAMVIGETVEGERFVCKSAPEDLATPAAMLEDNIVGRPIDVEPQEGGALYFRLA
jgi:acetyl-CoA C-acetyltransferase